MNKEVERAIVCIAIGTVLGVFGKGIYDNTEISRLQQQLKDRDHREEQIFQKNIKNSPNISPKDAANFLNDVCKLTYVEDPVTGQIEPKVEKILK